MPGTDDQAPEGVHSHVHGDELDVDVEPLDPARLEIRPLMSRTSWALLAIVVAATGFTAGAWLGGSEDDASVITLPNGVTIPADFDVSALAGMAGRQAGRTAPPAPAAGSLSGEVVLVSQGKVYVERADGSTVAVAVSAGTEAVLASPTDDVVVEVGDRVIVEGSADGEGVLGAATIVLLPDSDRP